MPTGKPRSGSEKRRKQRRITFRLALHEHDELEARAERAELTLGSYIRASLLNAPALRAVRRPAMERELLAQAVGLLGRSTGNLHQIAKRLNFGDVEYAADIPAALAETRAAIGLLMEAAGRKPREKAAA